jgi:hypothetical protein
LATGGFQDHSARATIRCASYGKVDLDCQAMSGAGQPNGRRLSLHRIPADPSSARDLHENAQILTRPRKRTANRRRIVRT